MENSMSPKKSAWPFVVMAVLGLLWVGAEMRVRSVRHQMGSLRLGSVIFQAQDSSTGQELNPTVVLPTVPRGQRLPIVQVVAEGGPRLTIRYVAASPLQFRISADGYEQQVVTVSEDSPPEITVRLKKS
jgi:hypothetical protein